MPAAVDCPGSGLAQDGAVDRLDHDGRGGEIPAQLLVVGCVRRGQVQHVAGIGEANNEPRIGRGDVDDVGVGGRVRAGGDPVDQMASGEGGGERGLVDAGVGVDDGEVGVGAVGVGDGADDGGRVGGVAVGVGDGDGQVDRVAEVVESHEAPICAEV